MKSDYRNMQAHRRATSFVIGTFFLLKIGTLVFEKNEISAKYQKFSKASQKKRKPTIFINFIIHILKKKKKQDLRLAKNKAATNAKTMFMLK